jgi:hypothetical protein
VTQTELPIFYAGPAGLAIEIGRMIRKNMFPAVFLYEYTAKNTQRYELAFVINE